jgi:hypothetical protein
MELKREPDLQLQANLLTAIETFPLEREVVHCGESFAVSPFDIYATCPRCKLRIKVRSFSALTEIEDVFDAVFTWMSQPGARELVSRRQEEIAADRDE